MLMHEKTCVIPIFIFSLKQTRRFDNPGTETFLKGYKLRVFIRNEDKDVVTSFPNPMTWQGTSLHVMSGLRHTGKT